MPLSFHEFMEEQDRAGDPNLGHTKRMWTTPSKELVAAAKGDPPWARHLTSHTEQVRLLIKAANESSEFPRGWTYE